MPSSTARRSVPTSQQAASKPSPAPAFTIDATEPLLTARQASEFLQVPVSTLAVWRSTGRVQLAYVKLGGAVRYRREDIARFIAGDRDAPVPQAPRLRPLPKPAAKALAPYPRPDVLYQRMEAWYVEHGALICDICGDRVEPIDARILAAPEVPNLALPRTGMNCLCAECNNLGCAK